MKEMIYADNAATTKLNSKAFEAMKPFLIDDFSNPSQPYSFSRRSKAALQEARETIAACINANSEEIFFTSGGTESDNWALKGIVSTKTNAEIITSAIEHHAILNTCAFLEKKGIKIHYLPVNSSGAVLPEALIETIGENTTLVSVMYANNEIGTIQPIKELTGIAHKNGALFHTDAVQAVGHVPIDVKALDVDLLSASAHKFGGPKGIGFLYVKKGTPIQPLLHGGSQQDSMRAGTENVAAIVGMAVALQESWAHVKDNQEYLLALESRFIEALDKTGLDYIRNGSENHLPGNINISIKDANGEMLLHRLDLMGICISTGSACDSVNNQVSHVIKAIKVPIEYAEGTIRVSLNHYNTFDEVITIAESIGRIITM